MKCICRHRSIPRHIAAAASSQDEPSVCQSPNAVSNCFENVHLKKNNCV